jgi:hypothetical protein
MQKPPQRRMAYIIVFLSISIPVVVMFWNIQAGVLLLLLGSYVSLQAVRHAVHDNANALSDAESNKLERHKIEQTRVIRVQLVDDYGRDLPAHIARQRMEEAQAKAGPRDTVVGVRHVLSKD